MTVLRAFQFFGLCLLVASALYGLVAAAVGVRDWWEWR